VNCGHFLLIHAALLFLLRVGILRRFLTIVFGRGTIMFKNSCWAQNLFFLMIVGLFILSIAGCGNKGNLYLPEKGSVSDNQNQKKS
jgi:predicted small lipoprotein YifL